MIRSLRRRIERLTSGRDDITLEEAVIWSYRQPPYDAETQTRYDDFARRYALSRLGRLLEEAGRRHRNGE